MKSISKKIIIFAFVIALLSPATLTQKDGFISVGVQNAFAQSEQEQMEQSYNDASLDSSPDKKVETPAGTVGDTTGKPGSKIGAIGKTIMDYMIGEDPLEKLENWILTLIGNTLLGLMSLVVTIAAKVLDGAIFLTVNMKKILEVTPIVDVGWATFRDLANMVFIFLLLYVAIATILGLANTKQMLTRIIITALLINFSLFFTKAVVDVSNIVALHFYNKIITISPTERGDRFPGPGAALFQAMRLQTTQGTFNNNFPGELAGYDEALLYRGEQLSKPLRIFTQTILGSVVMLVTAWMFLIGGVLLMIRIVTLMFLMMVSPLAFLARILPGMESSWNKWKSSLINNAIFAPAYLALLFVILTTAKYGLKPMANGTLSGAFAGLISSMGMVVNYIFVIILLGGCLVMAKQLGVHGANMVQGWTDRTKGWGKQLSGWAFSKTAGEWARRYEEKAYSIPGAQGWIASRVRNLTTQPLAETKWGGAKSAVDRHRSEKERKERFTDAGNIETVRQTAAEIANIRKTPPQIGGTHEEKITELEGKLQDAMLKISPSGFAKLATGDFHNRPELARYASAAQFQAIMNSDKTQKEKDLITNYRFAHITNAFERKRRAENLQKIMVRNNPSLYGKKLHELGVGWTKQDEAEFTKANDDVRGKSAKELGYLNRANPNAINMVAPNLNWWQIKDMRKSDDFSFTQREGKGNSLRDYKETNVADAADILLGIPYQDSKGNFLSIEERYAERERRNRLWQKVNEHGEDVLNNTKSNVFSDTERSMWNLIKSVPADAKKLALDMIDDHQKGRSPEELMNPPGRVRNIPVLAGTYGGNIVKPMMGKDNIHHKVEMTYLLRQLADGKLTDASKSFLEKSIFDRDGKDFYPDWKNLAKEMNLIDEKGKAKGAKGAQIEKLIEWSDKGADGQKEFKQVKTVSLYETLPGVTPSSSSGSSSTGTGGGAGSGGSSGTGSGGSGGSSTQPPTAGPSSGSTGSGSASGPGKAPANPGKGTSGGKSNPSSYKGNARKNKKGRK